MAVPCYNEHEFSKTMTWQTAITLQVLVSSFMTLFTRRVSLASRRVFFGMGVLSYCMVAVMGFVYSLLYHHGLPVAPTARTWLYIFIEGFCIPLAWLVSYKTISYIGAGNAVVVSTVNTTATALMGIVFLHDALTPVFVGGAALILGGALASLHLSPDASHHARASFKWKLLLVASGAVFFATGMFAEKLAINSMGAFNYTTFGWGMQLVGAALIFLLFGRRELPHVTAAIVRKGLLLGTITSIAGGLYVYALSLGSLSHTIVATSGKLAITVFLAAIFLHERNDLRIRIGALFISLAGLWLVTFG